MHANHVCMHVSKKNIQLVKTYFPKSCFYGITLVKECVACQRQLWFLFNAVIDAILGYTRIYVKTYTYCNMFSGTIHFPLICSV